MRRLLPILLLSLGACGDFPSATLNEPGLCKSVHRQYVPPANGLRSITVPMQLDLRPELQEIGVTSGHAHVTGVTVTAVDGVSDLGFIDQAQILLDTGADGGSVPVVSYGVAGATTLTLPGTGADLLPQALEGPLSLTLFLSGNLPNTAWHADVEVCMDLQARVSAR